MLQSVLRGSYPVLFNALSYPGLGFVRYGDRRRPSGLACVLSNGPASSKYMFVGESHAGEQWTDLLAWRRDVVVIDSHGFGEFPVSGKSVSVWVNAAADGRDRFRPL
jgi:alpha-amylase